MDVPEARLPRNFDRLAAEPLTPEEAQILKRVATGLRGAPQGWGWDLIIAKLDHIAKDEKTA